MESHADEHHDATADCVRIVRELVSVESEVAEREQLPPLLREETVRDPRPWRCGMCKWRCACCDDMIAHVQNKHNLESQYKCGVCPFKSSDKGAFGDHFETAHPLQQIDIISIYYKVRFVFEF